MDFRGRGFAASATLFHRDDAPKETFTRFQLVAFSSIFIDFRGFHGFHGFHAFSLILMYFQRFGWLAWLLAAGWMVRVSWLVGWLLAG